MQKLAQECGGCSSAVCISLPEICNALLFSRTTTSEIPHHFMVLGGVGRKVLERCEGWEYGDGHEGMLLKLRRGVDVITY